MTFKELKNYLSKKMKLNHLYQPLLIRELIDTGNTSTIRQLAIAFLKNDESQISYYEKRLKDMPIKVLSKHGVINLKDNMIKLSVSKLSFCQKEEIKKICEEKIFELVSTRGLSIWDHRFLDSKLVSDSIRYRVLKESKGKCALCGVTKNERPLDIDHIIPLSKGGKTEYENLQVLCSKCNRSKNNKDDTDFRNFGNNRKLVLGCPFCNNIKKSRILIENDYCSVILDKFPVTKEHSLIIPKRHFSNFFEITKVENDAIFDLLRHRKNQIIFKDKSVTGFNVGINSGESAGQTINHCHIHLIPRRKNDLSNPKGGVRGVIPQKMHY